MNKLYKMNNKSLKPFLLFILFSICLFSSCQNVDSARILGFFPWFSKSHFIYGVPLMKQLAAKGHKVCNNYATISILEHR